MKSPDAAFLKTCLKAAGKLLFRNISLKKRIDLKERFSLVTETDKQAETVIVEAIREAFPDHAILSEESGSNKQKSPFQWIIDPLDGTTNFAHQFPMACVAIGLEENGEMAMGGVYDPFRNELFYAEKGGGAFMNDKKISASETAHLEESLLVTGFPYDRAMEDRAAFYLSFNEAFMKKCQGIRRTGTAALDLCYVACGRFDGFWEFHLQPWDMAAASIIVREAGGRISDFSGEHFSVYGDQTLATNGKIHQEMVATLLMRLTPAKQKR